MCAILRLDWSNMISTNTLQAFVGLKGLIRCPGLVQPLVEDDSEDLLNCRKLLPSFDAAHYLNGIDQYFVLLLLLSPLWNFHNYPVPLKSFPGVSLWYRKHWKVWHPTSSACKGLGAFSLQPKGPSLASGACRALWAPCKVGVIYFNNLRFLTDLWLFKIWHWGPLNPLFWVREQICILQRKIFGPINHHDKIKIFNWILVDPIIPPSW